MNAWDALKYVGELILGLIGLFLIFTPDPVSKIVEWYKEYKDSRRQP